MTRIGERDTFSFEERFYLQQFVDEALEGQFDKARDIGESRKKSFWLSQEDRLAEWSLASRALELLEAAGRLSTPKFPTLESIVHGYAMTWRDLDRHHREMEQSVNQWQGDHEGLEALVARARIGILQVGGGPAGRVCAARRGRGVAGQRWSTCSGTARCSQKW